MNPLIDGIILSSRVSWDRGNKYSAIKKLESALFKYPNSDQLYSQLSLYYRDINDFDSARRYSKLRNIKAPSDHKPIIDLILPIRKYNIQDKVEEYSKQIVNNFSDNEIAIYRLANFASASGKISIAQYCYELALEKNYELENFGATLIEAILLLKIISVQ